MKLVGYIIFLHLKLDVDIKIEDLDTIKFILDYIQTTINNIRFVSTE